MKNASIKLIATVAIAIGLTSCTTIDREAIRSALLDYDPATDYIWDKDKGMGVWKYDPAYLLEELRHHQHERDNDNE